MRINKLLTKGVVFESTITKLLLNRHVIQNFIKEFAAKSGQNWEERGCNRCTPENKCKKHKALDKVEQATRCIKIVGLDSPFADIFATSHTIFIPNTKERMLLLIDCPPIFVPNSGVVSDIWIKKITPFTFGNMDLIVPEEIVQTIDLAEFDSYPILTSLVRSDQSRFLVLRNQKSGIYYWDISNDDYLNRNNHDQAEGTTEDSETE